MRIKFLLPALMIWSGIVYGAELHWERNLQSAFEKASETHRPLMVLIESRSCHWCKKMKRHTLKDEAVARRLEKFVLARVDRDDSESNSLPYARYVPTIYFMTSGGKILERVTGYFDIPDFKSWIDDAEAKLGAERQ